MARKFTFNPATAAQTARDSRQEELDRLETEINSLLGLVVAPIQAAFDATLADDKAPLDVQIADGKALRDKLMAMQAALAGTPVTAALSPDEKKLIALLNGGTIYFTNVEVDDPDNPGQGISIEIVQDRRNRRRRKPTPPAQNPAQNPNPAPAKRPPTQGNPQSQSGQPAPAPSSPTGPLGKLGQLLSGRKN